MANPIARVTDQHSCPLCTGPVPHVGGPIANGAPTVLAGDQPVARVGDPAICVGPADAVLQGASSVWIAGMPAARAGDTTLHGGVIVSGQPNVLVGGATFEARPLDLVRGGVRYGVAIVVRTDERDASFVSRAAAALLRLDSTPFARAIVNALEASGRSVAIESYDGGYNATYSDGVVGWNPDVRTAASPSSDAILGRMLGHAANPSSDGAATERAIRDDYAARGIRS